MKTQFSNAVFLISIERNLYVCVLFFFFLSVLFSLIGNGGVAHMEKCDVTYIYQDVFMF